MAKLTFSIGSNLGDREFYLQEARSLLEQRLGKIVYASKVIETDAWGYTNQSSFLNQVLILESRTAICGRGIATDLHRILDTTQRIEQELGRKRDLNWGPRTLDIDLIFVEDLRYEDDRISLPHPWWRNRSFVRDLLPNFPAPELGWFNE